MANKYLAKKVIVDGIEFDSKKEARRYQELMILQSKGLISSLRTQVKYVLIPSQRIDGKVIEREVSYVADFVYKDELGREVVEDVKGYRATNSPAYAKFAIKRKLMLYQNGIRIKEV